jgi:hypothetical protein
LRSAIAALLLRWRAGALAATLGALLYAAHPVQVECVAWISSRGDLLAALLLWSSLLLAGGGRRATALLVGALALLSKEQAIVWPLLALASDRLSGLGLRESVRRAFAPAAVTAVFLGVRFLLLDVPLQEGGLGATSVSDVWRMLAHQVGFALVPVGSVFDWQMPDSAGPVGRLVLALLAALPLAGLVVRRTRVASGWFLAALVPTLFVQLVAPLNIRVADRFILFALPALAAVGAVAATRDRRALPALAIGVLCCATLSVTAIPVWKSDTALWTRTANALPGHWRAEQNLGVEAFRTGDMQAAVGHLRRAAKAGPADAHTRYQLAWALERRGSETGDNELLREALREYLATNALVDFPRARQPKRLRPLARVGAAYLLLALGHTDEARAALESMLEGSPPPARLVDEFWVSRIDELARRVGIHLDEDLATRVREWPSKP